MDSEDIVICTPYNYMAPQLLTIGMTPRSKYKFSLATEPSFTIIIVQKENKNQNTLHKIRYIL